MNVQEWLGKDNQLGIDIWEKKYRRNNESLDEWFKRVSGGNKKVEQLIREKKFLFGGRILSNRGITHDERVTYSNCYVIAPPEDSIESIYESRTKLARTYSYGGGCGIDISNLAPAGAKVRNQAKATSGAVSFMQGYSDVTEEIGQNGRRGALMISIDCTHPDLMDFIDIKTKEGSVTKANISVKVSDDFMEAVINKKDWTLSYYREETGELIEKTLPATEIFHKICENNWNWAEPGILFWDTIKKWNLLSEYKDFEYAGVNPCAEEPLPAGGSCLLGSINLSEFIVDSFTDESYLDKDALKEAVLIATGALNDVLEEGLELHPLQEQRESVKDWRQIGLGIMGLADALIKLGIEYGSIDSLDFIDNVMDLIIYNALVASTTIAKKYGSFAKFDLDATLQSQFFYDMADSYLYEKIEENGLRNSQLLTCAPTGSIATMLNISGGVEPLFAKSWTRKTESLHGEDVFYKEYPKVIKELMEVKNIKDEANLPDYIVVSHEIAPYHRIEVQSALQSYIDASISSTINLPNSATVEDIEEIYIAAWKAGLKGVTIYRDGCARGGILTTEEPKEETNYENKKCQKRGEIIKPEDENVVGFKRKLMTGCGSLHCTVFFDVTTGELVETYLSKGSTGGCNNFMVGLSRMISLAARTGVAVNDIVDQLMSTGICPSYAVRTATKHDTSKGSCCPMAVGYAIKEMYEEFLGEELKPKTISEVKVQINSKNTPKCPECGEPLIFEGGCNICKSCGWSKCD